MAPRPANSRPAKKRGPASRARETQAAKNRGEALRLKIAGLTYREIGEKLRVHHSVAQQYVTDALAESAAKPEEVAHLREIERARLESMVARWLPIALADELDVSSDIHGEDSHGNPTVKHIEVADYQAGLKAVEALTKISARMAALYSLDGATKVEHSGAVGMAVSTNLAVAISSARAARLAQVPAVEPPPAPPAPDGSVSP